MQVNTGIQITNINTAVASNLVGMVVDASSAHRQYRARELRPASTRPQTGLIFQSLPETSKQMDGKEFESGAQSMCSRTWRLDNRHLPGDAWAMLVLNRTLCG